jgi:hypothetical protein
MYLAGCGGVAHVTIVTPHHGFLSNNDPAINLSARLLKAVNYSQVGGIGRRAILRQVQYDGKSCFHFTSHYGFLSDNRPLLFQQLISAKIVD